MKFELLLQRMLDRRCFQVSGSFTVKPLVSAEGAVKCARISDYKTSVAVLAAASITHPNLPHNSQRNSCIVGNVDTRF